MTHETLQGSIINQVFTGNITGNERIVVNSQNKTLNANIDHFYALPNTYSNGGNRLGSNVLQFPKYFDIP